MPWLSKKESAEYLGVCESTIDNLESGGMLKGHRIYLGKRPIVRYRQSDLDDLFLKRQRGRPREENLVQLSSQ
jgi:hypothetical protein